MVGKEKLIQIAPWMTRINRIGIPADLKVNRSTTSTMSTLRMLTTVLSTAKDFSKSYSLVGTITTKDGEFYAHLHMSAGDTEGRVLGGHLNEAVISATCELVLEIMDGTVERRFDPETGLNLMEF